MVTDGAEREQLRAVVAERAVLRLDAPVELASGGMSDTFVDVKRAMAKNPLRPSMSWNALKAVTRDL